MRSAVGKSCLLTTAKPHSGETTVEGSAGTRRTSDPVETGLRRARTRTKARAPQTGREVPGLPERRRDRQTPAGPRARSRWRGPDGKARRRGCWRTRDAPASLKEGWTRGRSQDGGRARAEPGEVRTAPGTEALRAAPSETSRRPMRCAHPRCCRTRVGRRPSTYSHLGRLPGEPPPLEAVASSGEISPRAKIWGPLQRTGPSPHPVVPRPRETPASGRGVACVSRGQSGGEAAPRTPPAEGSKQSVFA